MLLSKNCLTFYHRKKLNFPTRVKLATYLMNFECQPCGIFEGLLHHQKDEAISPTNFADPVGLVDRINKLVSSNLLAMVSSVSVIFDTRATY